MSLEAVHLAGLARTAERLARKRGLEADEDVDEDDVLSIDGSGPSRAIPVMTPPRYKVIEKGLAPLAEAVAKKVRTNVTFDSDLPVDAPILRTRSPWSRMLLDGVKLWEIQPWPCDERPGTTGILRHKCCMLSTRGPHACPSPCCGVPITSCPSTAAVGFRGHLQFVQRRRVVTALFSLLQTQTNGALLGFAGRPRRQEL